MPNKFEDQLRKIKISRQALLICILLFVCLIIWTGVSLISSQNTSTISPELKKMAQPLNPTLDREVLSDLQQKRFYTSEELRSFPIYKIYVSEDGDTEQVVPLTFTPPPTETRVSSPSATASPEPEDASDVLVN